MNISDTNKIVLQPLREVPQEVVFKSNTAEKDQIKPHRYWFKFPEQWVNQLDKDAIIGFRDMYIARHARYVQFEIIVICIDTTDESNWFGLVGKQRFWLDNDETIEKIPKQWEEFWFVNMKLNDSEGSEKLKEKFYNKDLLDCWYMNGELIFGRLPYKDRLEYENEDGTIHEAELGIIIYPESSDCEAMFVNNLFSVAIGELKIRCWSRHQAYLTCSISNEAEDNFLGYTRQQSYYPLKYYRLTSKDKKFWVELYESRCHGVPIILPEDNKDILTIEAIICFSSNAML